MIIFTLAVISTHSLGQTSSDTCLCGELLKGVLILKNNYDSEIRAHALTQDALKNAIENENDLKGALTKCQLGYEAIERAYDLERLKPKVVQQINTGWKWYEISALGIVTGVLGILAGHFIWVGP